MFRAKQVLTDENGRTDTWMDNQPEHNASTGTTSTSMGTVLKLYSSTSTKYYISATDRH